jgi:hypothetical protein
MTTRHRNLISLWLLWALLAALWVGYVLAQPRSYFGYSNDPAVFAFAPPIISLLAGLVLIWAWRRYGQVYLLILPEHLRRGLLSYTSWLLCLGPRGSPCRF